MSANTMSEVAAMLVARGWPKVDPPAGDEVANLPQDSPSWAYSVLPRQQRPGPQSVISLMLPGEDFDVILGIASCECCERVAAVRSFDPDVIHPIAGLSYWPGLDESIRLCRELVDGFLETIDDDEGEG